MRLTWLPGGWGDDLHWQETDRKIRARVNELIRDTLSSPFSGGGKPEPLKGNLRGWWSGWITQEHRLGHRVDGDALVVLQCRFHYDP
jgi:toxin YoeB